MGMNLDRLMQMYGSNNQNLAQTLGAMGRRGDSLVAHITPEEAMMLKAQGGAGTINPLTGMLEFYDADGNGNATDSGNPTGGEGSGGDGGFGSDPNNSGGGYADSGYTQPVATTMNPAPTVPAPVAAPAPATPTNPAGTMMGGVPPSYGFELNRLMQSYGVGTPSTLPYGGQATAQTDPAKYAYDQKTYQDYVKEYQNRLMLNNMYNQAQFTPDPTKYVPQNQTQLTAPTYAPGNFGDITNTYSKYFGRQPEQVGVEYWGKTGLTGDALQKAITGGAQNADLEYLRKNNPDLGGVTQPVTPPGGDVTMPVMPPGDVIMMPISPITPPGGDVTMPVMPTITPTVPDVNFDRNKQITDIYSKYFGRPVEEAGLDYWRNTGLLDNDLRRAITTGAQNSDADYFRQNYPDVRFARGGRVGYAEGGEVEDPNTRVVTATPLPPEPSEAPPAAAPAPVALTVPARSQSLEDLFSRYAAPGNDYTRELASARQAARTETEAFSNMIRQMSERGESPTSRAEMYFRLASAFGSPTKTGMFTENLALAGKEMGEYAKGRRTDEAERRGLALKAQELKMAGARQDLATTQALASQEGSERRAMAREILKEHLASGRPQSDAGKMAQDAGLVPGTPQYNEFVDRYIKTKLESGEMYRQAMLAIQEGNLEIRKMAEARQQETEKQLTPAELKMKETSEGSLSAARSALRNIEEALERNRNSFGMAGVEAAQYQILSTAQSRNPRVQNTRQIENLLRSSAIDSLKEKFGSGITNEERRALEDLAGAFAKTTEERRIILERSRAELQRSIERESNRLRDISSGVYRQRTAPAPAQPGGAQ